MNVDQTGSSVTSEMDGRELYSLVGGSGARYLVEKAVCRIAEAEQHVGDDRHSVATRPADHMHCID